MQGLQLERRNDGDVQRCGATTAPGREEYVCRPGVGVCTTLEASLVGAKAADRAARNRTSRRCGGQSCPRCLHTPPGGLQRGPPCSDTLGSSNWCCGVALPASTVGNSGTPDLGGGDTTRARARKYGKDAGLSPSSTHVRQ